MRWTRPLRIDARSLLRDSHQILTAFIDFPRTFCGSMMVNLKYPIMYDRIFGVREHYIVVARG